MPTSAKENEIINLLDYFEIIVKRRLMIARLTMASFVLAIIISLVIPKTYLSRALILPPQAEQSLLGAMLGAQSGGSGVASLASGLLGKGSSSDVYVGYLSSDAIKDAIIDRFKLMDVYKTKYRADTYKMLDKKASFEASKKDGIIAISVEDKDPQRATDMANAFVQELAKLVASMSVSGAELNRTFFEQRLATAKTDLVKAEDALKNFSQKNKTIQVPEQAKLSIEGISKLNAQLAAQQVQLAAFQSYLTDSNKEVINTKAMIASLKSQIDRLEGKGKSNSSIPSMGSVPSLGQEYLRLMREFKIQETLFELLTKQNEMLKISEAKDFTVIQIIQKARVPDKKIKPKRSQIVLVSTFVTFIMSICFAFYFEYLEKMPILQRDRGRMLVKRLFTIRNTD
jgi:uncharacterized protein involved in exopolysaccharide biosynthesis